MSPQPVYRDSTEQGAGSGAGVLLALPALEEQGLLEVGQDVYGALRNGFFGLRSPARWACGKKISFSGPLVARHIISRRWNVRRCPAW